MHIRVKWLSLAFYFLAMIVAFSLCGLAGFPSVFIAVFLPSYGILEIIYLAVSWHFYTWNQTYSTNHPRKGETIRFEISIFNEANIPLADGTVSFAMPGRKTHFNMPAKKNRKKNAVIHKAEVGCPYRGTYIAGMEAVTLTSALGIISAEINIQPQIFYVLPELYDISPSVEKYAVTHGATLAESSATNSDPSIFEYTAPLTPYNSNGKIAWKKWASTGIPSVMISGKSSARGISVFLDLYPCKPSSEDVERLAAEDIVMSAAFSVMDYLSKKKIPVNFVMEETEKIRKCIQIENEKTFKSIYEKSINIIFNRKDFPSSAFNTEDSVLLFTTRPIEELYAEYENKVMEGCEPGLFICPPQSSYEKEMQYADVLRNLRHNAGSKSLFYLADVRNGGKEVIDAFKI